MLGFSNQRVLLTGIAVVVAEGPSRAAAGRALAAGNQAAEAGHLGILAQDNTTWLLY